MEKYFLDQLASHEWVRRHQILPVLLSDGEEVAICKSCVYKLRAHIEGHSIGSHNALVLHSDTVLLNLIDLVPNHYRATRDEHSFRLLLKLILDDGPRFDKLWLQNGEDVLHEVRIRLMLPGEEVVGVRVEALEGARRFGGAQREEVLVF